MKKILILALLSISTSLFANNKAIDLQAEFRYDQQEALVNFIDAWLMPAERAEIESKFASLIRADARYRNTLITGTTGLVADIIKEAVKLNVDKSRDGINLFALIYFEKKSGIVIDTRSVFSSKPYWIK